MIRPLLVPVGEGFDPGVRRFRLWVEEDTPASERHVERSRCDEAICEYCARPALTLVRPEDS
jgi:hypothetical protein